MGCQPLEDGDPLPTSDLSYVAGCISDDSWGKCFGHVKLDVPFSCIKLADGDLMIGAKQTFSDLEPRLEDHKQGISNLRIAGIVMLCVASLVPLIFCGVFLHGRSQ